MQGSGEASIDLVTSVRSDLAVWSAGALVCLRGLSVHHTQCFSGNTQHLYYGWAIIHILFLIMILASSDYENKIISFSMLLFCLVLQTLQSVNTVEMNFLSRFSASRSSLLLSLSSSHVYNEWELNSLPELVNVDLLCASGKKIKEAEDR